MLTGAPAGCILLTMKRIATALILALALTGSGAKPVATTADTTATTEIAR